MDSMVSNESRPSAVQEVARPEMKPDDLPTPLVGLRRWVAVGIGLLLLGLGILGAILPGLPSTIFLLGASYSFARSSPRLHHWLLQHPHLGPPLRSWHRHRAMSMRSKLVSLVLMWTGVWLSSVAMTGKGPLIVVGLAVIGTVVVLFMVQTLKPASSSSDLD